MDDARIVEMVNEGKTLVDIILATKARRIEILRCCAQHRVLTRLRSNQTKPRVWPVSAKPRGRPKKVSDELLREMIAGGARPKEVAIEFGMSRQAVHNRMWRLGIKAVPRQRKKDAPRISKKYGMPMPEVRALMKIGATRAFIEQKNNARTRGIGWMLTFKEWWNIWQDSGHWEQRGRTKGCWVMGRPGDVGPYAVGNVVICTIKENVAEREKHSPAKFRLKNRESKETAEVV
jgi:hypothetical protein